MPLVIRHVRVGGYVLHRGLVRVFQGLLVHRMKPANLDFLVKSARRVPPSNYEICDDGINGSGLCLKPKGLTQSCNCVNGKCQTDGSCSCNAGWQDNTNGTKCSTCADGFFLSDDGSCKGMFHVYTFHMVPEIC